MRKKDRKLILQKVNENLEKSGELVFNRELIKAETLIEKTLEMLHSVIMDAGFLEANEKKP